VMGVCMGGTYALLAACLSDRFAAAAPFYGILSYEEGLLAEPDGRNFDRKPTSPLEAASQLRMPILASFAGEDEFVPAADVRTLERSFRTSGRSVRVDIYEGAGHAFLNRTREAAYRPEASETAWSRLIPFLREELSD
jgi:carboxymethylenebutenolidase